MSVTPIDAATVAILAEGATPPAVMPVPAGVEHPELVRLSVVQATQGSISRADYAQAMAATGWSKRHIQRKLSQLRRSSGQRATPKRRRFELTVHHKQVILACGGNIRLAYEQLKAAGEDLPSYETFWRRFDEQPSGVRAYARNGAEGLVDFWLYPPYQAPERNHVWQADHFELPNDVIADGCTTTLVKPWLTAYLDDKTRKLMGWSLVAKPGARVGADVVTATMCDAMRIRLEDGIEVGGVPYIVRWDNDKSFTAGQVTELGNRIGFECHAVPPYSGHMKGKVERFGGRVQEQFCALQPGYTHGPKTYSGKDPFRDTPPLTAAEMRARLGLWLAEYDRTVHTELRMTPLQAWAADATPLRRARDEELRSALLVADKARKVHKRKGVHFAGRWWQGAGMLDIVGRTVEIHYPVGDPDFIEVYYRGDWHCTGWPALELTEAQKENIWEGRQQMYTEVRELHDAATRIRVGADAAAAVTDATPSMASMPAEDPLAASDGVLYSLLERLEGATGSPSDPEAAS